MTIDELKNKVAGNRLRTAELEQAARDHEQKARDARAEMAVLKVENAQLTQELHNAATQLAAKQATDDAAAARKTAQDAATEAQAVLASLKAKEAELDKRLAETAPKGE